MSWIAAAIIGGAVVGAGASIYGSGQMASATSSAAKKGANAEMAMYNQSRTDLTPYRLAGYGALDQINQLYGINIGGSAADLGKYGDQIMVGGPGAQRGGTIDPITGTVTVPGDPMRSQVMTDYLRTGTGNAGGTRLKGLRNAINQLRASGWTYDPNRTAASGSAATTGQRDLSSFYTSPQYEFNRTEGLRGLENSAAARGGAFSGNAIRGSEMFASNLASGEFNNYVDRLFSIAGLGTNATNTGVAAGQNTANNIANIYQNSGNARGSSYLAGAAGVNNAIQGGLQNWMFYNYLNGAGAAGLSAAGSGGGT